MMRFTILGCGSSGGVPRLGNDWGDCDPENPKNMRLRCALLVERIEPQGTTRTLIDAGPDFRQQMLAAKVQMLDALVLTHEHADHIHGIDDMRQFINLKTQREMELRMQDPSFVMSRELYLEMVENARIPCYAGMSCHASLLDRFDYLFERSSNSFYPPILRLHEITKSFETSGAGGAIEFTPFSVPHGAINAYGFRIGNLAYLPDVFDLTDQARQKMQNLDILILDCLQFREHGTHANYDKAMAWIKELTPQKAILTNLHTPMDYDKLNAMTPPHISPAYDGLTLTLP